MKILLLTLSDQPALISTLHQGGHAITSLKSCEEIFTVFFRTRPHAVLVCGHAYDASVKRLVDYISCLPDRPIILHEPGDSMKILERKLADIRDQIRKSRQSPIADERTILFDPALKNLLEGGKLRVGQSGDAALIAEQNKLLVLLEEAGHAQPFASRYRVEIEKWSPVENREMSYRHLHGSFKAMAYAQEQMSRWLGVLAHFVPQVDVCYLPTPGDAITGTRWVFDGPSPEAQYAFACVDHLTFIPTLRDQIRILLFQTYVPGETILMAHASLALLEPALSFAKWQMPTYRPCSVI